MTNRDSQLDPNRNSQNRPQISEENFSFELRTNAQQWEYYIQMARRKQNNKEMDRQNRACHILTKVQHFPTYRKNQVGEVPGQEW